MNSKDRSFLLILGETKVEFGKKTVDIKELIKEHHLDDSFESIEQIFFYPAQDVQEDGAIGNALVVGHDFDGSRTYRHIRIS